MKIFDSNVWIAYLNKNDSQHKIAELVLDKNREGIIISEYIILEVVTVLSMRASKTVADQFIDFVVNNQDISLLYSSRGLFNNTLDYYLKHNKSDLSFVDISLLVLSENYQVITLDQKLEKKLRNK